MMTELQPAGQEQNLLLEDGGMDAEDLRIRNEALNNLVVLGNYQGYAEAMFYISKRATESGRFGVAERAGSEVLQAMQAKTQAELVKAFSGDNMSNTIQNNLEKIAKGTVYGKDIPQQ